MIGIDELKREYGTEVSVIILTCRVYTGTAADEELSIYISEQNVDWHLLYRYVAMHQLRPVVFKVLHKHNVPPEIKEKLQADCRNITFRNLEHVKEMVRVYDLLNRSGVSLVPWKGSVFSIDNYKDIGMRESSDIDFLINADVATIKKIQAAFSNTEYTDGTDIPGDFMNTYVRNAREYYFDLFNGDTRKFHVEFHWCVASQVFDFPRPIPNSLFLAHTRNTELMGKQINVLTPTYHTIAIVAHHGLNQRWELLKYVMDLAMSINNSDETNWHEIETVSKTYGFNRALNLGLYITDTLLGIKPPLEYQKPKNAEWYMHKMLAAIRKERLKTADTLLENLKIKDNAADKLTMMMKYLRYAASPSILDRRFLKLPKALYLLYALVKPIRIIAGREQKDQ